MVKNGSSLVDVADDFKDLRSDLHKMHKIVHEQGPAVPRGYLLHSALRGPRIEGL
jgi:hypothetical protein